MKERIVTPPLLRRGDTVAIVATARCVTPDEIAPAVAFLRQWGLDVRLPQQLFARENQFAGSDDCRAAMLQQMLDDSQVKAIFCARGGYGTVRIVDMLDWSHFVQHPKWVIGYSDVTVLHSHIQQQLGIATLHAIMPINFPTGEGALKEEAEAEDICSAQRDGYLHTPYPAVSTMRQFLFQGVLEYPSSQFLCSYPSADPAKQKRTAAPRLLFSVPGTHTPHADESTSCITAPVCGGNLSILYSLLGSASDIDTHGKILFLEDLDEYLYHIDRMTQALLRAGKLDGLAAVVAGSFQDMHDNAVPFGKSAWQIILDATKDRGYPVIQGNIFGHIGTDNLALPLGVTATLAWQE